jgi:hypothetical protein
MMTRRQNQIILLSLIVCIVLVGMGVLSVCFKSATVEVVNQTIHGYIRGNQVWRGEIHIVGDIIVETGATLTIAPGTKVLIAANSDCDNLRTDPDVMQQGIEQKPTKEGGVISGEPYQDEGHHISINVFGTLHAVGTPDQMITITSDSPTPGIYDWNHLDFEHGIISYCVIEYYRSLDPYAGTEVSHCILRHVGECCVALGEQSVLIEYNNMSYAGHELIDMHGGSSTIRYNNLGPEPSGVGTTINGGSGIVIDGGSPCITNNTFVDCDAAINFISPLGNPTIKDNTFVRCEDNICSDYPLPQK